MSQMTSRTHERLVPGDNKTKDELLHYLKHLFPYEYFKNSFDTNQSILEIGSGEGYGTSTVSKNVKDIVGIDIEQDVIDHANSKYKSSNCSFKLFDGVTVPFKDNHFDGVISFQVIEHIYEDKNYLREVYRVLKPGGTFICITPNRNYRLKPGQKPWNKYHVREYSPESIKEVFNSSFNDFEVMGITATESIYQYEVQKCQRGLSKYDPLNIRHLIPKSVKTAIRNIIFPSPEATTEDLNYSLDDYSLVKDNVEKSLDLVVVAMK